MYEDIYGEGDRADCKAEQHVHHVRNIRGVDALKVLDPNLRSRAVSVGVS